MSNRLAILIGGFAAADADIDAVLSEWANAGILDSVAWMDASVKNSRSVCKIAGPNGVIERDFFDLLTSKIWDYVTVIAVRAAPLGNVDPQQFDDELAVLSDVRSAFASHNKLVFRSATVSILDYQGLKKRAFNPFWESHLGHEPLVRIDTAVAAQPLRDEHRALLVTLLAVIAGGGFTWQAFPAIEEFQDPTTGSYKPIRVARTFIRVVNAGRLTDEVLAGAFPASGPWSVPPDVQNAVSVKPSTTVPEHVVKDLVQNGEFEYKNWRTEKAQTREKLNWLAGLRLFWKEYVEALTSVPKTFVLRLKNDAMDWLQSATFGKESSVLLSFDPTSEHIEMAGVVDAVQSLRLSDQIDAVGSSKSWEILQKVSLGLADAGAFPKEVSVPMSGSKRLIFTNPSAIGPTPSFEDFEVNDLEKSLLGFDGEQLVIGSMDLAAIRSFELRLSKSKAELADRSPLEETPVESSSNADQVSENGTPRPVPPAQTPESSRKARRAAKKAAKKQNKAAKKNSKKSLNSPFVAVNEVATEENEATNEDDTVKNDESTDAGLDGIASDSAAVATPIHKPNQPSFKPTDYLALASFYQGEDTSIMTEYADVKPVYEAAVRTFAAHDGLWKIKRGCDLCNKAFDHGVLFLHEPTQELIHVGHECARKHFKFSGDEDVLGKKIAELEKRWVEWRNPQAASLLYRVGARIVLGIENAEQHLFRSIEFLESRPTDPEAPSRGKLRFRKWVRRGLLALVLILIASLAVVMTTTLPLWLFAVIIFVYWSGLLVRLAMLARDLVRDRHRQQRLEDEYDRAFKVGRHAANEIVRLAGVYEQFSDWQRIIREVTHIPFGRDLAFSAANSGIAEVRRPPGFILAQARPDESQKMDLFLNAQSQTIHAGWLTEIMDILKSEWLLDYKNARLISAGDNVHPEADNAPSGAVVGKRPMSNIEVYYPRTDFRCKVLDGSLQKKLVQGKSVQIASDLGKRPIDTLLSAVEVSGLGSALNGLGVREFLGGLSTAPEVEVGFDPGLFSDRHPEFRNAVPEIVLPAYGSNETEYGRIQVEPGVEYTAAAWKIELSGSIAPFEAFKGAEPDDGQIHDINTGPGVA